MTEFSPERQLVANKYRDNDNIRIGTYAFFALEAMKITRTKEPTGDERKIDLDAIKKALSNDENFNDFKYMGGKMTEHDDDTIKKELKRLETFVSQYGDGKTLTLDQLSEGYAKFEQDRDPAVKNLLNNIIEGNL